MKLDANVLAGGLLASDLGSDEPSCRGPAVVLGSQAEQFLLDLGHAPRFALEVIDPVVEWSPPRRMPNKRAICSTIGGKR